MKVIIATLMVILGLSSAVAAETTTFKQQILPIDCVYEVIDVGTQKLRYITPDTCPIDPGPPVVTEPSTPPVVPEITNQPLKDNDTIRWEYTPSVVVAPPEQTQSQPQDEQVQGVIATIQDVIIQNKDSMLGAILLVAAWWVALLAIKKSKHSH